MGERHCATLECEKLHTRTREVDGGLWAEGIAALRREDPGSLCPRCGNEERIVARWSGILYDTPDGNLHPGDMYWTDFAHQDGRCGPALGSWTNCEGRHLVVVLPNGHHWDTDSRAANCTKPDDGAHRCWVRHGDPPAVTIDKEGDTCEAGGGSVKSGDYHGYLVEGSLVTVSPSQDMADARRHER